MELNFDIEKFLFLENGCPVINVPVNSIVYPQYNNAVSTMFCHTGYQRVGSARAYCDGAQWDRPLGICRGNGEFFRQPSIFNFIFFKN